VSGTFSGPPNTDSELSWTINAEEESSETTSQSLIQAA